MFKKKWFKIAIKALAITLALIVTFTGFNHFTQHIVAHYKPLFTSQFYDKIELTEDTDLRTIFLQTGIGENTAQKMIDEGRFNEILEAQELFFADDKVVCTPMIKWFTREEHLENEIIPFYDLQPGDVLVTLSTHTWGWRHGHAAIVLDKYRTVESISMLYNSSKEHTYFWQDYSNFAVLRVKDITPEQGKQVADFCEENLVDKPYSLLAGFGINKAPDFNSNGFSLHCSYLAWYAWEEFGVDLDSDGGRLVTSYDILHSDKVEIVQLYGMDPRDFIE